MLLARWFSSSQAGCSSLVHVLSGTRPIKSVHYSQTTAQRSTKQEQSRDRCHQVILCSVAPPPGLAAGGSGPTGLSHWRVPPQIACGWPVSDVDDKCKGAIIHLHPGVAEAQRVHKYFMDSAERPHKAGCRRGSSNSRSDHDSAVSCIISRNAWVSSSSRFNAASRSGLRRAALEKIQTVGPAALHLALGLGLQLL